MRGVRAALLKENDGNKDERRSDSVVETKRNEGVP
jgi:hypothetical protein